MALLCANPRPQLEAPPCKCQGHLKEREREKGTGTSTLIYRSIRHELVSVDVYVILIYTVGSLRPLGNPGMPSSMAEEDE